MTSKKYKEDLVRSNKIGELLREKVGDKSRHFAHRLTSITQLQLNSCIALVNRYISGYFVVHISDGGNTSKKNDTGTHLYRLAYFYELLEIDVNDPIITLTKEINSVFVYPPQKPPYSCSIEKLKFSHKILQLKPGQKKDLEIRALSYAVENLTESKQ